MKRLAVLLGLTLLACGQQTVGVSPSPSPSSISAPVPSPSASPVRPTSSPTPGTSSPSPTTVSSPRPSPAPSSPRPTPTGADPAWALRYLLLDHYPTFAFCDPDYYPVARVGGEQVNADDWWQRSRTTPEALAILAHHHEAEPLDAAQRLVAYQDHKRLTVIQLTRATGGYDFALSISAAKSQPDTTVIGTISDAGTISERSRSPRPGGCPICLEAVTLIATPSGEIEVARIQPGDLVYSLDGSGRRVTVGVARVVRRDTPGPHLMVRLALADGRVLVAAGPHPAADGRLLRDLHAGERYDTSVVASVGYVESSAAATYDLLPAGTTGQYWANGILVGSTLS
ncbi:MAG TPA: Hint domain-containing protein [Actinomycetota bacterium]|nr:Hint domain-containing protein [Actinomycetota bacterium]